MVAKRSDIANLPNWPRGLSREQAAAYIGVSPPTFSRHCPVQPLKLGGRSVYDLKALDRWMDGLSGCPTSNFGALIAAAHKEGVPPRTAKKAAPRKAT